MKSLVLRLCVLGLGFAVALATPGPVAAAPRPVFGHVYDGRGRPLEGATVAALGAGSAPVATATTDVRGAFSLAEDGAYALRVRCAYCEERTVPIAESGSVEIVVRRYGALSSSHPNADDIAAVPYANALDIAGLAPFEVTNAGQISDRGLGGGEGIVVDNGVAATDPLRLFVIPPTFPDRTARSISFEPASDAFRSGSLGGGGMVSIDPLGSTFGAADIGRPSAFSLSTVYSGVSSALAIADDGSSEERRADLGVRRTIGAVALDAGLTTFAESLPQGQDASSTGAHISARVPWADYAIAAEIAGRADTLLYTPTSAGQRVTDVVTSLQIEHPGPVHIVTGFHFEREASGDRYLLRRGTIGAADDDVTYVGAGAGSATHTIDVGVGFRHLAQDNPYASASGAQSANALLPSIAATQKLGRWFSLDVGDSSSTRLLSPGEELLVPGTIAERANVAEAGLSFDTSRRLRAELTAFREVRSGLENDAMNGLGASLAWQVAPRVSLRAWTLRDIDAAGAVRFTDLDNPVQSRSVVWLTYEGRGLRVDAIAHRDVQYGSYSQRMDASIAVPLTPRAAVAFGTTYDAQAEARRYTVGLRYTGR